MASSLKPDIFFNTQLPDDSDTAAALAHADQKLGGVQMVRVVCEWPAEITNPIAALGEVEQLIENEPLLSRSLSIRSVLAAMPGLGRDLERRLSLLSRAPPEVVNALYRPDLRRAIVAARVQDLGVAKYAPVYDRLEKRLAALEAKLSNE